MSLSPALFYLTVALALIGAELFVMQFSLFWFFFFGVGAMIASLLAWAMPELSWTIITVVFLLSSLLVSAGLYGPLRRWQDKPGVIAGNDAIGQSATVTKKISSTKPGKVSWSGTDWPAEAAADDSFEVGDVVKIDQLEGIRLIVRRS